MKKIIIIIIILFGLCTTSIGANTCSEQISRFYKTYLSNILKGNSADANAALCKEFFTEELINKVNRIGLSTDVDAVIRAQDSSEDAVETLAVMELGNSWYMVSYLFLKKDSSTLMKIPVKAEEIDGRCKIIYITPIWHGSEYGDYLLDLERDKYPSINNSSTISFLQSFYEAYTREYCLMLKDMNANLSSLRVKYLSPNAIKRHQKAEEDESLDGRVGYDLLIKDFDFDCVWRKTMKYSSIDNGKYLIEYDRENRIVKIVVYIIKTDDGYQIDTIE